MTKNDIQILWDLMAESFGDWERKRGKSDSANVWFAGLRGVTTEQMRYAISKVIDSGTKFSPDLPEFKALCIEHLELSVGLEGCDAEYVKMMNLCAPRVGNAVARDLSGLNPQQYWIYRNLGVGDWVEMSHRDAKQKFSKVYSKCIDLLRADRKFAPVKLIDSKERQQARKEAENRKNPEYVSKNKRIGISVLANLKRGLA